MTPPIAPAMLLIAKTLITSVVTFPPFLTNKSAHSSPALTHDQALAAPHQCDLPSASRGLAVKCNKVKVIVLLSIYNHYGTTHYPGSSRARFTSLSQPKDRSFSCDLMSAHECNETLCSCTSFYLTGWPVILAKMKL